jgi:pimeloyl-ACP methyl ester carboxylesterase
VPPDKRMWKKLLTGTAAAIAALLLYATVLRTSEILPRSETKIKYQTPYSHFLDWNGTEIHYTEAGQGMTVLMIHGLGGSCYDFALLDSMMRDSCRVIRVDLPGFGLSDFPDISSDDPDFPGVYNRFFQYFLDALDIDSTYVIGNSMGGMMSWYLAAEQPEKVKKLVLLNSAGYDIEQVQKRVTKRSGSKWVQAFVRKGIPEFMTRAGLANVFYNKDLLTDQKVTRVNDMWNTEGHMRVIFGIAATDKFPDTALIRAVTCPTLILWGKQDKLVSAEHAERFHRDILNSRVIVYDSCGHVPMLERPLDVNRDVRAFFAE